MVSSKPIPRENRFRMNRLIIISNRLPVTIERQENQFQFKKSVGGLATGMSSVYRDYEGMWVGWSGLAKEHLSTQESEDLTRRLRDELNNFPVFLSAEIFVCSTKASATGPSGPCSITLFSTRILIRKPGMPIRSAIRHFSMRCYR